MRLRKDREHSGGKPVTVECERDTNAKLSRVRVGKTVGSNGYITSYDVNPLSHLGMSRGDGDGNMVRTWLRKAG